MRRKKVTRSALGTLANTPKEAAASRRTTADSSMRLTAPDQGSAYLPGRERGFSANSPASLALGSEEAALSVDLYREWHRYLTRTRVDMETGGPNFVVVLEEQLPVTQNTRDVAPLGSLESLQASNQSTECSRSVGLLAQRSAVAAGMGSEFLLGELHSWPSKRSESCLGRRQSARTRLHPPVSLYP